MIKAGNVTETSKFLIQLANQMRQILMAAMELVWYMRGGLSYTEAMNMSAVEREIASAVINKRIEEAKGMVHPVF